MLAEEQNNANMERARAVDGIAAAPASTPFATRGGQLSPLSPDVPITSASMYMDRTNTTTPDRDSNDQSGGAAVMTGGRIRPEDLQAIRSTDARDVLSASGYAAGPGLQFINDSADSSTPLSHSLSRSLSLSLTLSFSRALSLGSFKLWLPQIPFPPSTL
jgi:hypothetical protein